MTNPVNSQLEQAVQLVITVLRQVRATADEHQQIAQAVQTIVQALPLAQPPPVPKP